jgi:hypothetical protein
MVSTNVWRAEAIFRVRKLKSQFTALQKCLKSLAPRIIRQTRREIERTIQKMKSICKRCASLLLGGEIKGAGFQGSFKRSRTLVIIPFNLISLICADST